MDEQICSKVEVKKTFYWNRYHLETMHHTAFYSFLFDFINKIAKARSINIKGMYLGLKLFLFNLI